MKKIALFLALILSVGAFALPAFAKTYMVNPFYAIESFSEYNNVKDSLNGNSNHMYFQWARLAVNKNNTIQFTNNWNSINQNGKISDNDIYPEYGFPGSDAMTDYKTAYTQGKAFLSVFFSDTIYKDTNGTGKSSQVEFLNMSDSQWKTDIIEPLVNMVNNQNNLGKFAFDGVVLDFEGFLDNQNLNGYSDSQKKDLKQKYNKFIAELKKSLGDKELIVCVHPTNVAGFFDGYDIDFLNKNVNYVILMAYDYQPKSYEGTSSDQYVTQPYEKVNEAVSQLISSYDLSPSKLLLGMDLSAVSTLKLEKQGTITYEYNKLKMSLIESRPGTEKYDSSLKVTRKLLDKNSDTFKSTYEDYAKKGYTLQEVEYFYESPQSITEKYRAIVAKNELSGLSVWRLGIGSNSIWQNLINTVNKEPEIVFTDVAKDYWGYEYINVMAKMGIISGKGNGIFDPEGKITRAEMVKLITATTEKYDPNAKADFKDVPENEWYYSYVASALKSGIIVEDVNFRPNDFVTREEMVVMICRSIGQEQLPDKDKYLNFTDANAISSYAVDSVAYAVKMGLIVGYDGCVNPRGTAIRAEAATVMFRVVNNILK